MESIKGKRGERSTPREAAAQRRLEEMAALLDELAPEPEEIRLSSPVDAQTWEPERDRFGMPMALGMYDGETIQPLVQSQSDWDRATIERE